MTGTEEITKAVWEKPALQQLEMTVTAGGNNMNRTESELNGMGEPIGSLSS